MFSDARSPDLIRVEAGAIELPPVLFQFSSYMRVMFPSDRWFVIHEVLERRIVGSSLKEVYFIGTLIGEEFSPAIVRSFGQNYSCAMGKPFRIGSLVLGWPKDWRMLDGVRDAERPGILSLKKKAPIELKQIECIPGQRIDKRKGWRRAPFPGHVEFEKGAKAQLLLGVNLVERIGFAIYHKEGPSEDVHIVPWAKSTEA